MLLHRHQTTADSSEPINKSIDAIKHKGVRIVGALKGKDSINSGIDFLLDYEIILNAHLVEFMTEFNNYSWAIDKKTNKTTISQLMISTILLIALDMLLRNITLKVSEGR